MTVARHLQSEGAAALQSKGAAARLGVAALLALTFGLGCLGSSPDVTYYTLPATALEGGEPLPPDTGIAVGPIRLPVSLDRPQIMSREKDTEVSFSEYERWATPLDREISRRIATDLRALLGTDRVGVYPLIGAFDIRFRVIIAVERLEGTRGSDLELDVLWLIRDGSDRTTLAVRYSKLRQPISGSGTEALVRAHGAAVDALTREIADEIRTLAAE